MRRPTSLEATSSRKASGNFARSLYHSSREFNDVKDDVAMSYQDKHALKMMQESAKLKDYVKDHHEIASSWESSNPVLQKNKSLAVRRLMLLKRWLSNDDSLLQNYSAFINYLSQNVYARKLTSHSSTKAG